MAFFRSAVFSVRVRDEDVPLGPAIILQVILNASDRAYDRLRAAERSRAVTRIMKDVSFDRARLALPAKCLQIMQNVSPAEQEALRKVVDDLAKQAMGPRSKSENLGLLLMNLVGEETLEVAVEDIRPLIGLPNAADTALLEKARGFELTNAPRLLALCRFLDPDRDETSVSKLETEVQATLDSNRPDDVKVTALVAALRGLYGSAVVQAAFARPEAAPPSGVTRSP